jgi:hypothetical protein
VVISGATGEGLPELLDLISSKLAESMQRVGDGSDLSGWVHATAA